MSSIDSKVRVYANDSTKWQGLQARARDLSLLFLEPYLYPKDISFELDVYGKGSWWKELGFNRHISKGNLVYVEITLLDHSKEFEDPSSNYYEQKKHPFPKLIGTDIEEHPYFGLIQFFAGKGVPLFIDTDYDRDYLIERRAFSGVEKVNKGRIELLKESIGKEEYEKLRSDFIDEQDAFVRRISYISPEDLHRPFDF